MKRLLIGICWLAWAGHMGAQSLTTSNLPVIVINTNGQEIPNEPKIMADMGIIYNGEGVRNAVSDPFNHYNGKIGIEIRGQSSQMFPMKSYSIELWDNNGNSQDKSLFGMPKESDWVLYAPYTDKTLMRNFLAYTFSRELGHWASRCRYVELVLNGDYKGIYVFMEKIKRGSGRVPVTKMAATDTGGDAVTGGYIFSIDKEADGWYSAVYPWYSTAGQNIRFSYIYPKITALVPEQTAYIKGYVDSFEAALDGTQFQDKQWGWRRFADEASFIDYMIVNEVSRNVDGYRLSSYFYKDRYSKGGKLIAGPVWDYDLAFRNANYCKGSDVSGWAYQFNKECTQDFWQVPFWWYRFEKDSAFQANFRCRWKSARNTSLSDNRIYFLIDSIVSLTAEARQRHFQRWPVLGSYIWPNPDPIPSTYAGEIEALKSWIAARVGWISASIPNEGPCYDYPASETADVLITGYPNPVSSWFFLDIRSRLAQQIHIRVTDVSGRIVLNRNFAALYGKNSLQLETGAWSPGIYFLSCQAASGEKTIFRLVRQ